MKPKKKQTELTVQKTTKKPEPLKKINEFKKNQ